MSNITLIYTTHSAIGKCTSDELYKIIESINPEVIFEELSNDHFDKIYNGHFPNDYLEVKCLKKYIKNHNLNQIPVDIDASPELSTKNINYMFETFKRYDVYKRLEQEQSLLIEHHGFDFLNSKKCSDLFDEKTHTEKDLLGFLMDKINLTRIHILFYEEQDKRESAMLKNIYNYAKENPFIKSVFLIGAAHRKAIIEKISEFQKNEEVKLNWIF